MDNCTDDVVRRRVLHLEKALHDEAWCRARMDEEIGMRVDTHGKFLEYLGAAIFVVALAWSIRHLFVG